MVDQTFVVKPITLTFEQIAARAGFKPGADGKLNLPANQMVADELAAAAVLLLGGKWQPGMPRYDVTLTGAGPVWGYLAIQHALHGIAVRVTYKAPNAEIVIFSHGL